MHCVESRCLVTLGGETLKETNFLAVHKHLYLNRDHVCQIKSLRNSILEKFVFESRLAKLNKMVDSLEYR